MEIVKILLGEDRGAEKVARISKHTLVFAFSYLLTQLLFMSCIDIVAYLYIFDIVSTLSLI